MLEKIIYNQLSAQFNNCKLLVNNQYDFTRKHLTEYASFELVDRIITHMDNNDEPFSIFLELSKAFDMIDHPTLINKLRYHGVVDATLKNLFKSYIINRKDYT